MSDFCPDYENLKLEEMNFIFKPLVQRRTEVVEVLLSLPNLWSYEELVQISIFLKQLKWKKGFEIFFRSPAVTQQFKTIDLPDRFKFIRNSMMLPYMLETTVEETRLTDLRSTNTQHMMNENLYDANGNFLSESEIESQIEETVTEENNLTLQETFEYYSTIKDCMCEAPYACSTMM